MDKRFIAEKNNDSSYFFNWLNNGIDSSNIYFVAYLFRCFSNWHGFICLPKNY